MVVLEIRVVLSKYLALFLNIFFNRELISENLTSKIDSARRRLIQQGEEKISGACSSCLPVPMRMFFKKQSQLRGRETEGTIWNKSLYSMQGKPFSPQG